MTDRTLWILLLSGLGCALTGIVIVLLLVRRFDKRHEVQHPVDLKPSFDRVNEDAEKNQRATQVSIVAARQENATLSKEMRVQMDSNQRDNEFKEEKSTEKLIWIKAMIARWFTISPPPPPPDEPK